MHWTSEPIGIARVHCSVQDSVMVAYGCHNLFLKIVISLVKTVYLCFYVFTPMCHISDCHVHCVYVWTTEFLN